jgi:hypothetical protein
MLKRCVAVMGAFAAVAAVAAMATAQQPVPAVAVTASPTSVSAQAAGPVAAGPTRFQVSRARSRNGLSVYVALLNAGVSLEQLQAALRSDDRTRGSSALGLVSLQASVSFEGAETRHDLTFTLKPGLTYVLVSEPDTQGDNPPPSRGISTFTTSGQANGATAPAPDATVRMIDLRFRGDQVLPRRGVVRVENFGGVPHFAIAFPLRAGATSAQFGRALRTNSQRAIGRLVAGAPTVLQNIISGGGVTNDQQVSFARAGRYALVCFFNEHHRLGMYRVVRVR